MLRLLALPLAVVALQQYDSTIRPLPAPLRASLQGRVVAFRLPRPALAAPPAHRLPLGLRRPRAPRAARREPGRRGAADEGVPAPVPAPFPIRHMRLDDMYGPQRARPADGDVTGSFRVPPVRALAVHGRVGQRAVVEPRVRPTRSTSIPLETRTSAAIARATRGPAVRRPLAAPQGDGDAGRRARVPLDRVGLGRRLDGRDEGLHALLGQRALARRASEPEGPRPVPSPREPVPHRPRRTGRLRPRLDPRAGRAALGGSDRRRVRDRARARDQLPRRCHAGYRVAAPGSAPAGRGPRPVRVRPRARRARGRRGGRDRDVVRRERGRRSSGRRSDRGRAASPRAGPFVASSSGSA